MALRKRVLFAKKNLVVAYRASAEPQVLHIAVDIAAKYHGSAASKFFGFIDNSQFGSLSGSEFLPSQSGATHLKGPMNDGDKGAEGPKYRWEAEVRAMSPMYIRNLVELFSLAGGSVQPTKSMSITGSLKVDDTPMSVREADVLPWLEDPDAWVGAYPAPPFKVKDIAQPSGVSLRLKLKGAATKEAYDALQTMLVVWADEISIYLTAEDLPGAMQIMPQMAKSKTALTAHWPYFTFLAKPTRDLLVNMLIGFHEKHAKIAEAELGFP